MKIVFFGLGSIGQKHAKILLQNYQHDLYAFRSGVNNSRNSLGIKEIFSWDEIQNLQPQLVFITNPTFLHVETAIKCAEIGCKLFIEKPIGKDLKSLNELLQVVKKKNLVTYIAYNLRFHPVIKVLKKYTDKIQPFHLRAVCTSYLPDWRPGTNHLKSYSANSKMGGGVILDLSHEIDYVSYLVGGVEELIGSFSKRGNVTVDTEDYADILVSSKTAANIHINFISHVNQRYIQIDLDSFSVRGDLKKGEIVKYKNGKVISTRRFDYNMADTYKDQMKYFFKNISNPKMMNNLLEAADLYKKIIAFKQKK